MFVDTNYFLRFLLADVTSQYVKAKKLFKEAATGKVKLTSSIVVFFEIYWVLGSFYEKKKEELVKVLENLLEMQFVNWENKKLLIRSVEIYKKTDLDFEDSYNLMFVEFKKLKKVASFDVKFCKLVKANDSFSG